MKRTLFLAAVLSLGGCRSSGDNLLYRQPGRADDPMYSIEEQERRGRARLSYVEDDNSLSPKAYVDRPGVTGR